jgi:putative DNA primase/helicase
MDTQNKGGTGKPGTAKYRNHVHITLTDLDAQVRAAMLDHGIDPPADLELDGAIHRFSTNGRNRDDGGAYQIHPDGIPAGWFQDWRQTGVIHFRADIGRELDLQERNDHLQRMAAMKAQRQAEEARKRAEAAAKTHNLLAVASPADPAHPYLVRKLINPASTMFQAPAATVARILGYAPRQKDEPLQGDILIQPVTVDGELTTAELIDPDGRKSAIAGGRKSGGAWMPEPIPPNAATIAVGEGAATVCSVWMACGIPVAAVLAADNLENVARQLRQSHPTADLILLADLVKTTREPDPHATAAALAVGGRLAVPDLDPDQGKDWNDCHVHKGLEAVREAIMDAGKFKPIWPDPQPLGFVADPMDYPLAALPGTIRAAVEEVAGYTQAPLALVAGSALGAVSIAIQGLVDVARADKLTGPVSLYLLTIAESGERKSTVDGFFTKAIHAWTDEAAAAMEPELVRYRADAAAWESKHSGIKGAITQLARKGKLTDMEERRLRELEHDRPQPPRVPRLTYQDITPEALAYSLATGWPTAGVLSSEAGTVLGGHAMGKDSMIRNLAFLNVAWEGGIHEVGRRTSESFTVKGARLTMSLAIQDATLRAFFDRTGTLARGTGWMARFLLAWPESTQGTRLYTEAPDRWPALAAFHHRLDQLLRMPLPFDQDGRLAPTLLHMTPAAKASWITFHDDIERELRRGGELIDVRDVASKSADNAARLAALFHVFEHGLSDIGAESFMGAARLAAFYLNESRRYFGQMAQAPELSDAARLDAWMLAHLRETHQTAVGKRHLQQFGPIRDGRRLDAALAELVDLDRLRLTKDGRQNMVEANPALL